MRKLKVASQVAKIDLLLGVGNIKDPEKRTMGTCCELQIEKNTSFGYYTYIGDTKY